MEFLCYNDSSFTTHNPVLIPYVIEDGCIEAPTLSAVIRRGSRGETGNNMVMILTIIPHHP